MESIVEALQQVFSYVTLDNAFIVIVVIVILAIFLLIRILGLSKEKKKLKWLIENKVNAFQKAFDISEDAILILSDNNEVVYINRPMIKLLELKKDFMLKPLAKMPKFKIKQNWIALDELIKMSSLTSEKKMHAFLQSKLLVENTDEEEIPVNLYIDASLININDKMWCNIISVHDLRKEEERVASGHQHKLTKLPNEEQALLDLNAFYSKIHLEEQKFALVLISIDNFSMLRSIVGYEQLNKVLIRFAKYLDHLAKKLSFSVYHTLQNNFLLKIPHIDSSNEVMDLVKEIQKELVSFHKMKDVNLHLTAAVGISIYPDSGQARQLLDYTYRALTEAEQRGQGRIHIYMPEKVEHEYDKLMLFNELHEAFEKDEFEVYYQPIVSTKDEKVVAGEALIRWQHPKHGLIAPDVFIPIMEKTGLIIELGQYVLEEVLKQQKRWELFKFNQIEVSINVTLFEIETDDFVENVKNKLQEHQVYPELIKFEITEGTAMASEEKTNKQFRALKKLGVGLSLDDFGTGYTSFGYLKKFPADTLKIDRTLVRYILTNQDDQRIVKAMIELGHNIGMKIVVEGIENKRMAEMIAAYGCDYFQGYYFSKPVPVFEFQKLLR